MRVCALIKPDSSSTATMSWLQMPASRSPRANIRAAYRNCEVIGTAHWYSWKQKVASEGGTMSHTWSSCRKVNEGPIPFFETKVETAVWSGRSCTASRNREPIIYSVEIKKPPFFFFKFLFIKSKPPRVSTNENRLTGYIYDFGAKQFVVPRRDCHVPRHHNGHCAGTAWNDRGHIHIYICRSVVIILVFSFPIASK